MTQTVKIRARPYRNLRLTTHNLSYQKVIPREGNFVPGVGDPCASVMFIGEAPGAEEEKELTPFVGRSGQLLDVLLEGVLGLQRRNVYITNLVKVRPPGNDLKQVVDEVPPATTLMRWEINIVKPRVIVPLGRWAAGLFFQNFSIVDVAGQMYIKSDRVVVPMLHPSYVLRTRGQKAYALDFQKLKKIIEDVG